MREHCLCVILFVHFVQVCVCVCLGNYNAICVVGLWAVSVKKIFLKTSKSADYAVQQIDHILVALLIQHVTGQQMTHAGLNE